MSSTRTLLPELCGVLATSVNDLHTRVVRGIDHTAYIQCVHKVTEDLGALGKLVQTLPSVVQKPLLFKMNNLKNVVVGIVQELTAVQQVSYEERAQIVATQNNIFTAALDSLISTHEAVYQEVSSPLPLNGLSTSQIAAKCEQTLNELNRALSLRDKERFFQTARLLGDVIIRLINSLLANGNIPPEGKNALMANLQQLSVTSNTMWENLEDPIAVQAYNHTHNSLEQRIRRYLTDTDYPAPSSHSPPTLHTPPSFPPQRDTSKGLSNFHYVDSNSGVLVTIIYTPINSSGSGVWSGHEEEANENFEASNEANPECSSSDPDPASKLSPLRSMDSSSTEEKYTPRTEWGMAGRLKNSPSSEQPNRFFASSPHEKEGRINILGNTPRRRMNDPEVDGDELAQTWAPVDKRAGEANTTPRRVFGLNRGFTTRAEDSPVPPETNSSHNSNHNQKRSSESSDDIFDAANITVEIEMEDKEEEYQLDCDIDFIRLISRLTQQHCSSDWETLSRRDIQKFESQINSKLQKYKETFLEEHSSQIAKMKSAQASPPISQPVAASSTKFQQHEKKKASTPLFGYKKRDK